MKVRTVAFTLALAALPFALTAAKKEKTPTNPKDPYSTAEFETAPAVSADDLAIKSVVFENVQIPTKWESDARRLADATLDAAIARLASNRAFDPVGKQGSVTPAGPYFLVKSDLKEYRMVGTTARIFAGIAAGTSYLILGVRVMDGQSGMLLYQREVSTENNAFAAAWSLNDRHIPQFVGNVLGDYLALRARKDKGVDVLPLSTDQPK